jgi:hypothetical protein
VTEKEIGKIVVDSGHKKQLLVFTRLAEKRFGFLMNFGKARIKDGIARIVNDLPE